MSYFWHCYERTGWDDPRLVGWRFDRLRDVSIRASIESLFGVESFKAIPKHNGVINAVFQELLRGWMHEVHFATKDIYIRD